MGVFVARKSTDRRGFRLYFSISLPEGSPSGVGGRMQAAAHKLGITPERLVCEGASSVHGVRYDFVFGYYASTSPVVLAKLLEAMLAAAKTVTADAALSSMSTPSCTACAQPLLIGGGYAPTCQIGHVQSCPDRSCGKPMRASRDGRWYCLRRHGKKPKPVRAVKVAA